MSRREMNEIDVSDRRMDAVGGAEACNPAMKSTWHTLDEGEPHHAHKATAIPRFSIPLLPSKSETAGLLNRQE